MRSTQHNVRGGVRQRQAGSKVVSRTLAVGLLALGLVSSWGTPQVQAQANNQREHDWDICFYKHATTRYRYIPSDSGSEYRVDNETLDWMITGRTQWNASPQNPTSFQSQGFTATAHHFRIFRTPGGHPGLAGFLPGNCLMQTWPGESRMYWNSNEYVKPSYTDQTLRNVGVHEVGHTVGLGHTLMGCNENDEPVSVMAYEDTYYCEGTYGPYVHDNDAASRIRVQPRFYFRDTLNAGAANSIMWQTESDGKFFRGRPSGTRDSPGHLDDDIHLHPQGLQRRVNYRAGGPVGKATSVVDNFPTGNQAHKPAYIVAGNFNGAGGDGIASFAQGQWRISQTYSNNAGAMFLFGIPGDHPVVGDWDGNGTDTIGIYRQSTGQFHLRNSNSAGAADISFYFGIPGDIPVFGNWDTNDLAHEVGVVRGRTWYLRRHLTTGVADVQFNFPEAPTAFSGMQPVLGNWDGSANGSETPGYLR